MSINSEILIGNVLAVNELIAADKQAVHAVDKDGATPLMFAAMRGHTEVHWGVGLVDIYQVSVTGMPGIN